MDLMKLKPEEMSLAFQCIAGQHPLTNLPPQLQKLQPEEWKQLAYLLIALEMEQKFSPIH